MAKVEWKDDEIEIDNEELLRKGRRADVSVMYETRSAGAQEVRQYTKAGYEDVDKLGGIMERGGEEEKQLKEHKRKLKWSEPTKKIVVKHVCPVCGTHFEGRRNKVYCSTKCKEIGKKRKQRDKTRGARDFKPHIGTAGEVYFMSQHEGKDVITFVPALYATDRKKASEYIYKHYGKHKNYEDYIEQVKEVIPK